MPAELPARIGPFEVLEVLGRGGMGVVLLAKQTEPVDRKVAVKLIRRSFLDRLKDREPRLAIEIYEALARVMAERMYH